MENIRQEVERDAFITSMSYRSAPLYFWFEYTDPYYGHNPDRDEIEDDRTLDLAFHFKIPTKYLPRFFPTMELIRRQNEIQDY